MAAITRKRAPPCTAVLGTASWLRAVFLIGLILVSFVGVSGGGRIGKQRPCEEIYVVGEEETLNTISDKCGDPFIVDRNPHIQDPDDVYPGLVIKIIPSVTAAGNLIWFG